MKFGTFFSFLLAAIIHIMSLDAGLYLNPLCGIIWLITAVWLRPAVPVNAKVMRLEVIWMIRGREKAGLPRIPFGHRWFSAPDHRKIWALDLRVSTAPRLPAS